MRLTSSGWRQLSVVVYLLLVLFMISPIVSVMVASSIAKAHGCQLDEGSPHPCIINGVDRGELLYEMGVAGWFIFLTVPAGIVGMVIFHAIRKRLDTNEPAFP
jgi:hypothetical protein